MPGKYQNPETIRTVVEKIDKREWILPSIQRRFVWDTERITNLFDSLMQGYPIGTLMVWKVCSRETINKIGFYDFLQDYQERFRETCNDYKPTSDVVYAVIDGQQRLNSIYIGLKGSYAEKLPRKKWRKAYDSSIQPKMYLYINLCEHDKDDDNGRFYNLSFMSDASYNSLENKNHWYKVGNILDLPYFDETDLDEDDFDDLLTNTVTQMGIEENNIRESKKTLKRLYKVVFTDAVINYYLEQNDNLDRVVDIFVRTNSGGVPLAFSDLVMSVTVSEWPEARTKIDELVNIVRAETGVEISRDFVLKSFLYLFSKDIKFRIGNFTSDLISVIENKLDDVGDLIKSVCLFSKQIGLNDESIRAKYALLPLLYYSYKNNIQLDNLAKNKNDRKDCGVWLKLALIKGLFGGSPDSALLPIKNIITDAGSKFPAKEIVRYFIGKPRNLTLTDEEIETRVLETNYGTNEARLLLSIVTEMNTEYVYDHIDHCYPKDMFSNKGLSALVFLNDNEDKKAFYADKRNWNTLGNLQLLNSSENESKKQQKLSVWLAKNPTYKSSLILPVDSDGNEIIGDEQFKEFVETRRKMLCKCIKDKVSFSDNE